MTKKILLDANLLISAYDSEDADAQETLRALLNDEDTAFAISPLIRYEVLRGVSHDEKEKYQELKEILNSFEEFDVGRDVSELSSNIFRYARYVGRNIVNKRSFDVFHFATAKCNHLELISNDGDIDKIENLYIHYSQNVTTQPTPQT